MDWYIKQQHEQHEQLRQRQLDLQQQQEATRQRIKMKQRHEAPAGLSTQVWRDDNMMWRVYIILTMTRWMRTRMTWDQQIASATKPILNNR